MGRTQALSFSIALLFACGGDPPKPANAPPSKAATGLNVLTKGSIDGTADLPPDEVAPPPPGEGAPKPEGEEDVSEIAYAYSPIGKRDPFRSLFDQLQREEQNQQLTELQKFELDQLKLVAIVSRIATPYAMVEDPTGKGHTLTRGTLIGKNWGRVAQIKPDCVVVKEEYRDYTGRKVTNKTDKCLPKPEELKVD
jgi:type IV pilus assembly protein PilP